MFSVSIGFLGWKKNVSHFIEIFVVLKFLAKDEIEKRLGKNLVK